MEKLTKPFSVTRFTKGVIYWYHGIYMGHVFPYIQNEYEHLTYALQKQMLIY